MIDSQSQRAQLDHQGAAPNFWEHYRRGRAIAAQPAAKPLRRLFILIIGNSVDGENK
jgi:hypothetical protein